MKHIFFIFLVIFCVISLTPFVTANYSQVYFAMFVLLTSIALFSLSVSKKNRLNIKCALVSCQIAAMYYFGFTTASIGIELVYIASLCSVIFVPYIIEKLSYNQKIILIVCVFLTIVGNVYYFSQNDVIVAMKFLEFKIGDTEFLSACLLVFSISTVCYFQINKRLFKILLLLFNFYIIYYMVFIGLRATLLILLSVAIVVLLINNVEDQRKRKIYIRFGILLFVFLYFFSDTLFTLLTPVLPDRLAERAVDLQTTSHSGVSDDSFSGRGALIYNSLRSWLSSIHSFFIGIGDVLMVDFSQMSFKSDSYFIGCHAEFFDTLGRWGIIGFTLIYSCLKEARNFLMKSITDYRWHQQILSVFIIYILLGFLKNVFVPSVCTIMFIFLPCVISININNKR